MTNKFYDVMKKMVEIVLPATSSAYFGLSQIWGLPGADKVVGSIAIVTTFIGATLNFSAKQYYASGAAYDGEIIVEKDEGGVKGYSLELPMDPEDISTMKSVAFEVVDPFEDSH